MPLTLHLKSPTIRTLFKCKILIRQFFFQLRLRDGLFSTLAFSKAKSSQTAWVAWVDGVVKMSDDIPDIKNEGPGAMLASKQFQYLTMLMTQNHDTYNTYYR